MKHDSYLFKVLSTISQEEDDVEVWAAKEDKEPLKESDDVRPVHVEI